MVIDGGRELHGSVPIPGYKHALTVVVAAAVATARPVTLRNVPHMTETWVLKDILEYLGATGTLADGVWQLDTSGMRSAPVPFRMSGRIHGSLYLVPALLARFGEVSFAGAGGDRIGPADPGGSRPTDQVVSILRRFGATVETTGGLHATASRLRGCSIDLMEFSTHPDRLRGSMVSSATKTALILAAAADGPTRLRNPVDRDATWELADFLRTCGSTIARDGDTWCVRAGGAGSREPVAHYLISDSTGIVTFIACAAHVGGSFRLTGLTAERTRRAIADELGILGEMGVPLSWGPDWLEVRGPVEPRPVDVVIECNGFSTDAHPLLAVPLLRANGVSRVTDHVWPDRFAYARLLAQMGARIEQTGNTVALHPSQLESPAEPLRPTDSRAAAAALVAALGVRGSTRIDDHGGHLDRGYELLTTRLLDAGASIEDIASLDGA